MIIQILILAFVLLIVYQLFLAYFNNIEGLETYQPYDEKSVMIMQQKNAGNIEFLKGRLDDMSGLTEEVQDISGNVSILQTQMLGLVQSQQDYASQMLGTTPPEITGVIPDEVNDVNNDVNNDSSNTELSITELPTTGLPNVGSSTDSNTLITEQFSNYKR